MRNSMNDKMYIPVIIFIDFIISSYKTSKNF
jgi:hypothetical protein